VQPLSRRGLTISATRSSELQLYTQAGTYSASVRAEFRRASAGRPHTRSDGRWGPAGHYSWQQLMRFCIGPSRLRVRGHRRFVSCYYGLPIHLDLLAVLRLRSLLYLRIWCVEMARQVPHGLYSHIYIYIYIYIDVQQDRLHDINTVINGGATP
jgi:hypothetical protein